MKKKKDFWMVPEPLVQQFKKKRWGSGDENDPKETRVCRDAQNVCAVTKVGIVLKEKPFPFECYSQGKKGFEQMLQCMLSFT